MSIKPFILNFMIRNSFFKEKIKNDKNRATNNGGVCDELRWVFFLGFFATNNGTVATNYGKRVCDK